MQTPQAPNPPAADAATPAWLAPVTSLLVALLTKLKVPAKYQVYVLHVVVTFAGTFVTLVSAGALHARSWSSLRDLVTSAIAAAGVAVSHYVLGLFKKTP